MATATGWRHQLRPGIALRTIVQQATAELVAMDAERLEELAQCCLDLNRECSPNSRRDNPSATSSGPSEIQRDLKLLERILFETKANISIFTELETMRVTRQVNGSEFFLIGNGTAEKRSDYGND